MKLLLTIFAILILCAAPLSAHAQRINQAPMARPAASAVPAAPSGIGSRIVAVVNDNIITSADLNARIAMAILSSGLPDAPEVRQRLVVQIMRVMIDEQLQLQEAKKLDITVSQAEIDKALEVIAADNHIPGGDLKAFLGARGIPPQALVQQIRAGLSWSKVVQRELRPRVDVGDEEIEAMMERTRANAGKQEFLVSEIFLSVDNPKDEEQVKQFAGNLAQQLKQGGNFGAVARQFSQSASAATGGDIGWIQEGQQAPEISRALESLIAGTITEPVRAVGGYYILGLREKRTITLGATGVSSVAMQQVFRPFGANKDKTGLLKETGQLRAAFKSCSSLKETVAAKFPAWQWQDLGEVNLATAPSWLADKGRNLPVGSSSEPMATAKGALILFVCGRKGGGDDKSAHEAIVTQLGTEKLELQARGLLRDLRRDAYLDVRLGKGS